MFWKGSGEAKGGFANFDCLPETVLAGYPPPLRKSNSVVLAAGPAKTPEGLASGSFGPTTAGRMDGYVDSFMRNGGSFVTLAKGNR